MTCKCTAQTNQQQKSEKPQESGILQRAAVRSVSNAGVQSTEDQEAQPLGNSALSKDFSRVPISTTKPQQIMAKLMIGAVGDKYEQEADRVAAQVVQRINAPASVQSGEDETVQREEMETKDNQARLMRSPILQRSKGKRSKHHRKQGRLEKASGEERFIPPEADKPYSVSFTSKTTNPYTTEEVQEILDQYKPGDLFKVNPNRLRTMHAGISDKFGNDIPIADTIEKFKNDKSSLKDLPTIKVAALEIPRKPWERQTSNEPRNITQLTLFTEDHRRVVAAREAGVAALTAQLKATPSVVGNYTTKNMGMSVEVRSYQTVEQGRHQRANKSTFPGSGKVFQYQDEELQMKPRLSLHAGEGRMNATSDLEASINQAKGGGQPLAPNIREPMEQAFGADFSRVKIYTDAQSDQLNRSIQASAFTTGQDVFFRQGEYNPGSRRGQELIAHELTHVVQQNPIVSGISSADYQAINRWPRKVQRKMKVQRMNRSDTVPGNRLLIQQFQQRTINWMNEKQDQIEYLYEQPGGWEGWCQGELSYIARQLSAPALREGHVYDNRALRADFVLLSNQGGVAVELKCESFHQQQRFANAVNQDTDKLSNLPREYFPMQVVVYKNVDVRLGQPAHTTNNGFKLVFKTG